MTTTTASPASLSTWKLDPAHSGVEFKIRHMMISNVKGKFHGISGVLSLDEADLTRSRVEVTIDAATLDTGDVERDAHLKSAEFFDVINFPILAFNSTGVVRKGDAYAVTGELTIHGTSRSVTLDVEDVSEPNKDPWGNLRIGLSASTKVNRKDYGLTWNSALETGGVLVGDEVTINLDIQFMKD